MRNIRNIIKLADQFISTAGKVHDRFKDKSGHDALDTLKNNIQALRSPETLVQIQKSLQNKSPAEVYDLLTKSHKNLSALDALKLADLLTDGKIDRALPDFLDQKIKDIQKDIQKDNAKPKPPKKGK